MVRALYRPDHREIHPLLEFRSHEFAPQEEAMTEGVRAAVRSNPRLDRSMHLRGIALAVAALALFASLHLVAGRIGGTATSIHAEGSDDAYISYRYAHHLVTGHGLVFNPGERVEGYSNLLWVLASSAVLPVVGVDRLHHAMATLGLLAACGLVLLAGRQGRRIGGPVSSTLAAWLTALTPSLWAWSVSGLEAVPVALLQFAAWPLIENDRRRGPLVLLLGTMVLLRADGFVSAGLVTLTLVLRGHWPAARMAAFATGVTAGAQFAFRFLYYGEWFPNTFYAKVSGPLAERLTHGVTSLLQVAATNGLWIAILGLVFLAISWWRAGATRHNLPYPLVQAGGLVGYWLWVGGDHFGERFLLALFPCGAVGWATVLGKSKRPFRSAAVAVVLCLQLLPVIHDGRFRYRLDRYDGWITLGRALGEDFPGHTLALGAAGKIPYFSQLPTLDMRGLTDHHIAHLPAAHFTNPGHDKEDLDYVLGKKLDLIVAWVGGNLDMSLGLERGVYESHGYRLRLLVNSGHQSRPPDVVDIAGWSDAKIRQQVEEGFRLGVLERHTGP